ncbi:hypothetical protein GALL_387230 [mine drainage metagenome]|uniref:Uncharacterized protein n=1 Tax=mine drainage metagenome TaxID=410659 RepID=A0A1J5QUG1_9ZZZZ
MSCQTYSSSMYSDADVDAYVERLRSPDSAVRALAADEATDGVSDWGRHSYTGPQAHRVAHALVDALAVESDGSARESIVNALAGLVSWDLVPHDEVSRALALARPDVDPAAEYWGDLEDWDRRHGD